CAPTLCIYDDHFAEAAKALNRITALHHSALLTDAPDHGPTGATTADALLIVYTSGSTGTPKGAVLAQKALIANAKMAIHAHDLTTEDNVLNVLPMFHVGGLNILPTPAFSIGATVTIHERFDPDAALTALTGTTLAIMVPTVMKAIMSRPGWATADFSRLRGMSIGSTDVPRALINAAHDRGVPMIQIYGATETSPYAIYQTLEEAEATAGSLGRVGIACQARLVQPDGTEAPIGEPGEIWIKGDNILTEYWNNPAETARAITDGWFHSGDVATLDENGLYWFTDRIKHVIISGGENIYPAELERILNALPNVTEAAVVGRPDPKWGEMPVAVVVGNTTREDILNAFQGTLARYKHPRDVVFAEALPRNAMGKIVAAEVRKLV
ncbi:MAG: class I adenylate-forming enzyme family protein, partial [Pikeienuella sp.]